MAEKSIIINEFGKLIELLKIEVNLSHNVETKTINMFKIDALERNMKTLAKMNMKTNSDIVNVEDVTGIKGFGKGTLAKIDQIIKTGTIADINILKSKLKKLYKIDLLVKEISKVIGIGSITALRLIQDWDIKSLQDLKDRVTNGEITVNDKIKLGLNYEGKFEKTIKNKTITKIYSRIKKYISSMCNSIICGSYRRQLPVSHDIDMLIWSDDLITKESIKTSPLLSQVIKSLKKSKIITDDITDENVKHKYMGFVTYKNKTYRIDIRLICKESLYTAILYFTGSYEFNIKMRNRAKNMAYHLNEYALTNVMGKPVQINSEEHVFKILNMKYLEPYER